jgi:NTE family protein
MVTAFVLSGAGSLGAVQVGMLQALAERNVRPDLLIGTSAGAVNAAYVAGHGTTGHALENLASIWCGLRRRDVFPSDPLRHLLAVAGRRPALCSNSSLGHLIADHMPYARLEDAAIPVHVVATNLLSGEEVLLSEGDTVNAVIASASIPGVFPPVEREGLTLVDGGVADNAALSQALVLGADEVYVLPAGYACALERPPTSALAVVVQALTLLIQRRLITEVETLSESVSVKIEALPPLCPQAVSAVDFGHARDLIGQAHEVSGRWLDSGGTALPAPKRFLSLHDQTSDAKGNQCDIVRRALPNDGRTP